MGLVTRDVSDNGRFLNTVEVPSFGYAEGVAIGSTNASDAIICDRGTAWVNVDSTTISGDAVASVTLQTSFDGSTWTDVGAAMGAGKHVRSGCGPYIRVALSATGTTGTADVKVDAELV